MTIHINDDGVLDHLDVQLVITSNQKLNVKSPPSQVSKSKPKRNVLDVLRKKTIKL